MEFVIERAALLRSLSHVQNIVERRPTIPIVSNVRIHATGDGAGGRLDLTATDLDITLITNEEARVLRGGTTTVSAHTLFDIVRKLPDGSELRCAQEPGQSELRIEAGRSQFMLPTLAADEFPAMAAEELSIHFTLPPRDLGKLIDRSRFAVSTEDTRYYLNGIHMHVAGTGATAVLRGVATDGHRLARVELGLPDGASALPPIIVPRKTVAEVRKLVDETDEDIAISVSDKRIQFGCGRAVLISKLIDGTFPDYERVIPQSHEREASLPSKAFSDAVDRVATISADKTRAVKLSFKPDHMTLSAVSTDSGRASEDIDCQFDGDSLEIGFNARYILEMMAQVEGDEVRFELTGAGAPAVVRDLADSAVLYVLMPMRV